MAFQSVGIVGAGAWGTALAITARRAGRDVLIWAYEPETLDDINTRHRNTTYLPGVTFDPGIEATARFNEVATCDVLLIVTPAQHVRGITAELAAYVKAGEPLVICAKGIEQGTGMLLSQIVGENVPAAQLAVLSGPSFAAEVARGRPAALTLANGGRSARRSAGACAEPPALPLLLERRRGRRARSAARSRMSMPSPPASSPARSSARAHMLRS